VYDIVIPYGTENKLFYFYFFILFYIVKSRAVDPDPAFQVNSDPIRIKGFDDQKLNQKIQLKFFKPIFDQKLQFTYP
jgi:hypothetical protein